MAVRLTAALCPADLERLVHDWPLFAHAPQRPPPGSWRAWLLLGGRGSGKTRAGAQWLGGLARRDPHYAGDAAGRIALVSETYEDARAVMIEGDSGLLAVAPRGGRPAWHAGRRELSWPSGAVARLFSANDPEALRGSQFGAAWCDEIAKWAYPDETFDMLQFCLRLGRDPRQMLTTTPKPIRLLKRLVDDPALAVTRAPTLVNRAHLAPGFHDHLLARYGGSRLGRQEIDGEIVEDRDDALWRREWIETRRRAAPADLQRVVVAVDPPAGAGDKAAACGIVAAGIDGQGNCFVLADRSFGPAMPGEWARRAVSLFHEIDADAIVAETNQGGEMVAQVIAQADANVPVRPVRARRGKWLRAEPVAALYEAGRVFHAAQFCALEDEMCAFGLDGLANGRSPDRVDALVWAVSELMLSRSALPRIRSAF